jgi:hypothetical protein
MRTLCTFVIIDSVSMLPRGDFACQNCWQRIASSLPVGTTVRAVPQFAGNAICQQKQAVRGS